MDEIALNSFLKFGYRMDYTNKEYSLDFTKIDKNRYCDIDEEDLIRLGIDYFLSAIQNDFVHNQKHLVPLSGGLDSRAILASLMEFTNAENIYTYTFGTPGTLDYEIGNQVGRELGTKHIAFPLPKIEYNLHELLDISKRVRHQTVLFNHPPVWMVDKFFSEHIVWSGYVGDAVTGGHLPKQPVTNLEDAKKKYLEKMPYVNSIELSNYDSSNFLSLVSGDNIDRKKLTYEEQVLFKERCDKLTAPHVLIDNYNYITPFINNEFMDFMFSIDNKFRANQYLFKKILLNAFPKAFSYPTKTSAGLSLNAHPLSIFINKALNKIKRNINNSIYPLFIDKSINYIDFNYAIRNKSDLNEIIKNQVNDLKNRNIIDWVNPVEVFENHINKKGNYADALIVLSSLEIHLKSKGRNEESNGVKKDEN